jgi:hypothetical protein
MLPKRRSMTNVRMTRDMRSCAHRGRSGSPFVRKIIVKRERKEDLCVFAVYLLF